MMFDDLRLLLAASPTASCLADFRTSVLEDNVLGKASASARQRSFRYLRELYGLDLTIPSFRALRRLWEIDPDAQPLLALAN